MASKSSRPVKPMETKKATDLGVNSILAWRIIDFHQLYFFAGPFFFFFFWHQKRTQCPLYFQTISTDNTVEIQPFRVFPAYFKLLKDEAIDIYVEFMPESSGMHAENIILACNNGEVRSLDLLADGIAWHRYYFTFQARTALKLETHFLKKMTSFSLFRIRCWRIFP